MRERIVLTFFVAALAAVCSAGAASVRGTANGMPGGPPTQKAKAGTPPATVCNVDAYVLDPDPKGLNVRDAPGVEGRVVAVIPLDADGTNVHLTAASPNGWVQIDRAETIMGAVVFDKKGWVSGNMLGIMTRGYEGRGVKLYDRPRARKAAGKLPSEDEVKVAGCEGDWMRVKYKSVSGWLAPADQCSSPVTTCN
jgi:SH3-like domain-containing protein